MAQQNFYVYRHIRLDTNVPFYIGKGKGSRAYSKANRNRYWNNIVKLVGYKVELVLQNLSESDSFTKETEFIKLYTDLGFKLANLTKGGEGISGYKFTQDQLYNLSKSHLGIKLSDVHIERISESNKGKKRTEIHKEKYSSSKKGSLNPASKPVINLVTGEIHDNCRIASEFYKISYSSLRKALSGMRRNKTQLRYI